MSSMIVETGQESSNGNRPSPERRSIQWGHLIFFIMLMGTGSIGGPIMQRLYYVRGGSRKWLQSCLQSIGFPILLPPLILLYSSNGGPAKFKSFFIGPKFTLAGVLMGLLVGLDNYMSASGQAYIPVSTSSLLFSTQLVFTAIFAFIIVKQKFTFHSMNSVVVMTLGAVVLALHTSSDHPPGVSNGQYLMGFFFTLGAAAILGLLLPTTELCYMKVGHALTFTMVMQFQVVATLFATLFCLIGMAINKDFEVIPREAKEYEFGEVKYYVVLVASAIVWQLQFIGTVGVIYSSSSLFAGIVLAVLLPFTEVAGVIAFNEQFTGEKGLSLALCLWGFVSYFAGEHRRPKKMTPMPIAEPQENDHGV